MSVDKPISDFFAGLLLSLRAFQHALTSKRVWHVQKKSAVILFSLMLLIYAQCLILYLPVHIGIYISSFIFETPPWLRDSTFLERASQLFYSISFLLPLLTVFVTDYLIPKFPEAVLFASLSSLDPKLVENLKNTPAISFWSIMWRKTKRLLRLLLLSALSYLLSLLPLIGGFVFPAFQFYITYRIFGYKSAFVLALPFILPPLTPYAWPFLQILFGARALAIETLDPYFTRVGYDKIRTTERDYQAFMLGFALPSLLLMSVPLIGPIFWGLVQACSALLLLQIIPN